MVGKHLFRLMPLLLLALLLASCENTSGPRFEGDVFTVAGLLKAGQPVNFEYPIYVTRSSAIEDFNPLEIFVYDATVTIRDLDADLEFQLTPALHEFKFKYIDLAENIIQPGHRYRIEVLVPGADSLIWAETTVPIAIEAAPDPYGTNPPGTGYSVDPNTENTMPFSLIDSHYPVFASTGANAGKFNLMAGFYCLEPFSTDLEFTSELMPTAHPDSSLADSYNAGQPPRRLSIMYRFVSAPLPGLQDNYLVLENYSSAFIFYGRYRIRLLIVDDNYFNYNFMEEGYLHGGIHNALGYFGSASGVDMYARIVK